MPERDICYCPFNKLHVVPKTSLQKHIIKCMKNYPEHEVCPYNALHRFLNNDDYVRHILQCPDKTLSVPIQQRTEHGDLQPKPIHVDNVREFNLEFEDWDL